MFFDNDPEIIKHGYYEVDGIKTLSKFEAYQFAKGNFDSIKFVYNDDELSKLDWTVEPTEDIYELYAERARQLRGKYDYLVLLYSGGIDSHTILKSFLNNNIHLDEICTFTNADVEGRKGIFNQEVFNAAIPFVNSLNLTSLGTKFRLFDISNLMIQQYADEFHLEHNHYYSQGPGNNWPNAVRSHLLKASIKDHMVLNEQGKSICYIWGFDKPTITWEDNKYYVRIPDSCIDLNMRQFINRKTLVSKFANFYDEPFYICKEFPKISIKQGHMLLNLIKTMKTDDIRLKSQDEIPTTGPFVVHHRGEYFRFLSKKTVDSTIYPRENVSMFGDDKVRSSLLLSAKDNWFTHSNHENRKIWFQNLDNLIRDNRSFYKFKNNKVMRINYILSQPYFIGEFDTAKL